MLNSTNQPGINLQLTNSESAPSDIALVLLHVLRIKIHTPCYNIGLIVRITTWRLLLCAFGIHNISHVCL